MLGLYKSQFKRFTRKGLGMSRQWKEVRSTKLSTEEIEKLLRADFGEKVQPVDQEKLARQHRQRARYGNP